MAQVKGIEPLSLVLEATILTVVLNLHRKRYTISLAPARGFEPLTRMQSRDIRFQVYAFSPLKQAGILIGEKPSTSPQRLLVSLFSQLSPPGW